MNKDSAINNIIYLPGRFYKHKDVSIYSLLKESGYFELHDQISEANIFDELTKHSECIDQWLAWSANKRSSSGWYFKQNENGKYIVGFSPPNENLKVTEYFDIAEACAAFVKREIEDIRKS
jgi:hypothetical protein